MNIPWPTIFDTPIKSTKVRKNIFASRYRNGLVLIGNSEIGFMRYYEYSTTEAIKKWRATH